MGRGGTIPAWADAMALASVGPMRIGTRSSESGSSSSTTISSSARCWRTPTTSTGTSSASSPMQPTLRRGRRSGAPRGQAKCDGLRYGVRSATAARTSAVCICVHSSPTSAASVLARARDDALR